jgi:hypothetical protein
MVRVMEELKHRVELGVPHPRKVAGMKREPPGAYAGGVC